MSQQPDERVPPVTPGLSSNVSDTTQQFKSKIQSTPQIRFSREGVGPESLGRYRIVSTLGKGGFGAVYRAVDEQLERDVAIKVTLGSMLAPSRHQDFLTEARIVAALDHPNIVPVYDVGQTDQGDFFVVSKLIEGGDLSARIKLDRPDRVLALRIVEQIADALNYAHSKGLVHRDIKPGNILLDRQNRSYLTDFGLALRETERQYEGDSAGTPAYMSPEQARGEGHRIDNRSDIYSLGVVLYELLAGRRPFRSDDALGLMRLVSTEEVRSPRLFDDTIPPDLERICMKALARRASDRFTVARDLADEIRWFVTHHVLTPDPRHATPTFPSAATMSTPVTSNTAELDEQETNSLPSGTTRIIPKGLRSFDSTDASFFLELLPGPFDREGLPEGLRFWKTQIEETDPEKTFKVGLVYGPSGCGKSSMMKAGLLPRLSSKVIAIYLEATPDDTEIRLLRAVRKAIPGAEGSSLKEILSTIRRRRLVPSEGKLVLVLDQFEQWLFAEKDYAKASLTDALLQCDGATVQAIVMVREDFWISVSRFLRELEVSIERTNSSMVDLFDMEHAAKVLSLFGRAYGKLPDSAKNWSQDQHNFVQQAVKGLAQDHKVVSVRIAVLAHMMKSRAWTTDALREVGGIDGVGTTFLEEMFGSKHAPIQHRQHQEAVRGLLSALLPISGTEIKGTIQSTEALQKAAGYERKPREFQELMGILDVDLRLITPVDDGSSSEIGKTRSYQLAHDYMVPSLRDWLTQKQRESKKGRAELKLTERAAAWSTYKESKQLPTFIEWLQIRCWTEPARWTANEKLVMRQASRHHVQRTWLATIALVLLSFGVWFARSETLRQHEATRIAGLVDTLTNAEPAQIPEIVKLLDANPAVADQYLLPRLTSAVNSPKEQRARLHARLASVSRDTALVDPLVEELLTAKVSYLLPIRQLLRPSASKLTEFLKSILHDDNADPQRRFRSALALSDYESPADDATWTEANRTFIAQQLVSSNAEFQTILREALRPIQDKLLRDLERIFGDSTASEAQRLSAANAMADYAAENRTLLTHLLTLATPEQHAVLYPSVSTDPSQETIEQLSKVAAALPQEDLGSVPRIAYGQRRANAAVTMLKLGEKERVLSVFDWTDDPEALTQFIFRCRPRGIRIDSLLDLLDITTRTSLNHSVDTNTRLTSMARFGLLLAVGEYAPSDIPPTRREELIRQLTLWYANDPSSCVHGASGWLLRHLGEHDVADKIDQTQVPYSPAREWFTLAITVNPTPRSKPAPQAAEMSDPNETELKGTEQRPEPLQSKTFYYTFVVQPSGEYTIGSLEDQLDRQKDEVRHKVTLTRPFAMLNREITFEELIAFSPQYGELMTQFGATPRDAGFGMHWYDSVAFCRWLGKEMGLAETNQCYPDPVMLDKGQYSREPNPQANWAPLDWPLDLDKRGFRLPTESEWEVIARGGSRTSYGFGSEVDLLNRFGWFAENSGARMHPPKELRPNMRGLFDLHGNLFEWTHDWNDAFEETGQTDPLGPKTGSDRVNRGGGWASGAANCRAALRYNDTPTNSSVYYGFRISLVPSEP